MAPSGPHSSPSARAASRRHRLLFALLLLAVCAPAPALAQDAPAERRSIVLVVIESLRADAVSAYGSVQGTTPTIDRLAASGTRYERVYAASSWTPSSHASLFTGLRVDEHGVGLWGNPVAASSLRMIAEQLRGAGYATAGFSENPVVGPAFGFDQGFGEFASVTASDVDAALEAEEDLTAGFDVVGRVRQWFEGRDPARPFFLFVHLFDPHHPYRFRTGGRFLPPGVREPQARATAGFFSALESICSRLPAQKSIDILRGLYLGEVAHADGTLAAILEVVQPQSPLVVVTSDHGEHFGEQRLLGHRFSLHDVALRVPLVVSGAGGPPKVVTSPVEQRRLHASLRCWAGLGGCAEALPDGDEAPAGPIIAVYGDDPGRLPAEARLDRGDRPRQELAARLQCDAADPVVGRIVALIRPPLKLLWHQHHGLRLYDLAADPGEQNDLAPLRPPGYDALAAELRAFVRERRLDQPRRRPATGSLRQRAAAAWAAASRVFLSEPTSDVGSLWFLGLALRAHGSPELEEWLEAQLPGHAGDPFYPILVPDAPPPRLPPGPGSGVSRWMRYVMASVASPEAEALELLGEYLEMEASGYALTHQLTALEWAAAAGRPLPEALLERRPVLLERIAAEQAADPAFSDLYTERAGLLAAFGSPRPEDLRRWVQVVLSGQVADGDWGASVHRFTFDGRTELVDVEEVHTRALAMVVLASFLGG